MSSKSKMVLITAQTTAFFENADQMGVQHATVVQLALEGIQTVEDLAGVRQRSTSTIDG